MTKAEVLKRIDEQMDAQHRVSEKLFELTSLPSIDADTTVIVSAILTINSTICDTMNTLALILCEMMPCELLPCELRVKEDHDA